MTAYSMRLCAITNAAYQWSHDIRINDGAVSTVHGQRCERPRVYSAKNCKNGA